MTTKTEVASTTIDGRTAKRLGRLITDLLKNAAVQKGELRPALQGLCFEASANGALQITGADGFKLVSVAVPLGSKKNALENALRARPVFATNKLAEIVKILKGARVNDKVQLQFTWTPAWENLPHEQHAEGATFHVVNLADSDTASIRASVGIQSSGHTFPKYDALVSEADKHRGTFEQAAFNPKFAAQVFTALRECGAAARFRSLRTNDASMLEVTNTGQAAKLEDETPWAAKALIMPFYTQW